MGYLSIVNMSLEVNLNKENQMEKESLYVDKHNKFIKENGIKVLL